MKRIKFFGLIVAAMLFFQASQAQSTVTDSIIVNGNCGMCQKAIEKSALESGATTASWDRKVKVLTVSYDNAKTSNEKIQKAVAAVGYDTEKFKAPDEVYEKLHGCCLYDRSAMPKKDAKK